MVTYLLSFVIFSTANALKGLFINFKYTTFFPCLIRITIIYERSISIKQLWLENLRKMVLKVSPYYTYVYIIYIIVYLVGLTLSTLFSQLLRVKDVLSRWTFHKKCSFCWPTKKRLYIQNWWAIPFKHPYII